MASQTNASNRELVYCHQCQEEWYRDTHGLVCPNESCLSDFVEIVENNNDPRGEVGGMPNFMDLADSFAMDDGDDHGHPHGATRSLSPGGTTFIRLEGPHFSISRTSTLRGTGGTRAPGEEVSDDMIVNLFQTMIRNIVGDQHVPPGQRSGEHGHTHTEAGESGEQQDQHTHTHTNPHQHTHTHTYSPFPGLFPPPGARLNPRDANSAQTGETPQAVDLGTFLANFLNTPTPRAGEEQGFPMPPAFLARLFPGSGAGGDYVYSQSELDRVISQLMEQHQGNAPPPAPKETIESLPKIKVTEEMVNDGTDCAVCKDDLELGTEVTKLPCKHVYHFECVSKWLEVHDTCPICRHSVTPEEKRQEQQEQRQQAAPINPFVNLFSGAVPSHGPMPGAFPNLDSSSSSGSNNNRSEDTNSSSESNASNNANQGAGSGSGNGPRSTFASLFRRSGGN
ncbi:hypothetical protein EDC01DRAFT_671232 [Geopyxis carbonaria]|nr:hypothetical protein EDC01DRAFT_671232 [Geopyxis carbonaria]